MASKQCVLVILGHKESGKTQLSRRFLRAQRRSVVVDTIGEYGGVLITDPWSLSAYLEARGPSASEAFRVSYRDNGQHGIPPERVFKMLQALRNSWVCFEEASKWMGPNQTPEELLWFLQYGRHNGLSVLVVARRPSELDRMATAQADVLVSFRQHEPRDLDYLKQIGGQEAADRIAALGDHEWDYVLANHAETEAQLEALSEEVNAAPAVGTGEPAAQPDESGQAATPAPQPAPGDVSRLAPHPLAEKGDAPTEHDLLGLPEPAPVRGRPRKRLRQSAGGA